MIRNADNDAVNRAVAMVANGSDARKAWKGGPDYLGEEAILHQLRQYLVSKGVGASRAEATAPGGATPCRRRGLKKRGTQGWVEG